MARQACGSVLTGDYTDKKHVLGLVGSKLRGTNNLDNAQPRRRAPVRA
jgi:hypothetical protein